MDCFKINENIILRLINIINDIEISPDSKQIICPKYNCNNEKFLLGTFLATIICHQTNNKLHGWVGDKIFSGSDYLLEAFLSDKNTSKPNYKHEYFSDFNQQKLEDIFNDAFDRNQIELDDLVDRARMISLSINDVMSKMGNICSVVNDNKIIISGKDGIYNKLSVIHGFMDKQKKKSSVYLTYLYFSNRFEIVGLDSIDPMIDYHRMRLFLRLGVVEILDTKMQINLVGRDKVSSEISENIRELCFYITKQIQKGIKLDMPTLDMLLWAHARSNCRNRPICNGNKPERSTYSKYVKCDRGKCVFENVCSSSNLQSTEMYWEPNIITEDY